MQEELNIRENGWLEKLEEVINLEYRECEEEKNLIKGVAVGSKMD